MKRYVLLLITLIILSSISFIAHSEPKMRGYHNPIHIVGDGDFTSTNGVVGGSGTPNDPYIIANWTINASNAHGIWIENTNAYVIIKNCTIYDGVIGDFHGIYLNNANNITVENCILKTNKDGILAKYSNNIRIDNVSLNANDWYGLYFIQTKNITIKSTEFLNNGEIGAWFEDSSLVDINCVAKNNKYTAIYLSGCKDFTIRGGIQNSSLNGINVYNSNNISIFANISKVKYGINSWYSSLEFYGFIKNSTYGLRVSSISANISNSKIENCTNAIYSINSTLKLKKTNIFSNSKGIYGERSYIITDELNIQGEEGIYIKNSSSTINNSYFFCEGFGFFADNSTKILIENTNFINDSIMLKGDEIKDFYINVVNSTANGKKIISLINSTQNLSGNFGEVILVNYSGTIKNISFEGGDCSIISTFSNVSFENISVEKTIYGIYAYSSKFSGSGININQTVRGIYTINSKGNISIYTNNSQFGIYSQNSSLEIEGKFLNTTDGIFSSKSSLFVNSTVFKKCNKGIYAYASNVSINNGVFISSYYGIYSEVSLIKIYNVSMYGGFSGLWGNEIKPLIENSRFFGEKYGLYLIQQFGGSIKNTSFSSTSVYMDGSSPKNFYVNIENTTVNNKSLFYISNTSLNLSGENMGEIIAVNCTGNIYNLTTSDLSVGAILAFSNLSIFNSNIHNSSVSIYATNSKLRLSDITTQFSNSGIGLYNSEVTVNNSKFLNCTEDGIYAYNTSLTINYSTFTGCFVGVNSLNSQSYIRNSTFQNCGRGIKLIKSDYSTIIYSIFRENYYGIYIQNTTGGVVSNNSFVKNNEGIFFIMSSYNRVIYNNFTRNNYYAIDLTYLSNYNEIHHNNFWYNHNSTDNYDPQHVQVRDDCINYWSSSSGGNYWSDWTSPDNNNDGIVDNPYVIDSDSQDDMPLAHPVEGDFPVAEFMPAFLILILPLFLYSFLRILYGAK